MEIRRRPLQGLRVLDLSQVVAGPYCARLLGDLGAEVIKIEPPEGDQSRVNPYIREGYSSVFMTWNCGKKGVSIDLRTPEGLRIVKQLAGKSDILIESFTPGVMERLGLGYQELKLVNPKLIMCSISSFGQYGPYSQHRGFGGVAHAMSGIMWLAAKLRGPDVAPEGPGFALADMVTAVYAFGSILAVLHERDKSGQGQHLDLSLVDCAFAINTSLPTHLLSEGKEQVSKETVLFTPVYNCRGHHILINWYVDRMFKGLVRLMERPDLLEDKRFANAGARRKNQEELRSAIEEWLEKQESVSEASRLLREAGLSCGAVLSFEEAVNDPQVKARKLLVTVPHPVLGDIQIMNNPIRCSDAASEVTGIPPKLGEHNEDVLVNILGYPTEEVAELTARGVLHKGNK